MRFTELGQREMQHLRTDTNVNTWLCEGIAALVHGICNRMPHNGAQIKWILCHAILGSGASGPRPCSSQRSVTASSAVGAVIYGVTCQKTEDRAVRHCLIRDLTVDTLRLQYRARPLNAM
jgi:hypothetical protein